MSDDDTDALFELSSSSGSENGERDDNFKLDSDSSDTLQELLDEIGSSATRSHQTAKPESRASKRKNRLHRLTTPAKRRRRRLLAVHDSSAEDSVAETISLPSADDEHDKETKIPAQDPTVDRTPRVRRTKSYPERVAMETARVDFVNKVPPMPQLVFLTWKELGDVMEKYCSEHFLLFRARDTQTVKKHNSLAKLQIPNNMQHSYKVFRCTHGCPQKPRGKGLRSTPTRYTGCRARVTATVMNTADEDHDPEWRIVLRNWTWTHNHRTNASIYSSYFGAGSVPENSLVADQVGVLADANTGSHHIQEFLSGALERHVTSQQARNIVRKVLQTTSADKKLSRMLDTLASFDDNEVLILQDQNDVTSGVVMQTAVQKLAFERWGETLCMDWTYGTNNLGYHLGSLLVTSATGRGVPVLDFIALDEKESTMEAILKFFKRKNEHWAGIETFVIDKDFKEWRVLEKCFPDATVLLCQFHTMANWKKVVRRAKYGLSGIQQDEVEYSIKQMMYSTSVAAFNRSRDGFEKFCKGECPDICSTPCPEIFKYFQENWEWCSDMWANHARGKYFTAGNTTTNRIESNWNQLKRLLGRKTRIDRTIAGLLQNQVNIVNHLLLSLRRFSTQSRPVDSIPLFLRRVAGHLSNDALAKVSSQWDLYMVNKSDATCTQIEMAQAEWKVYLAGKETTVDDTLWSCNCLFYKSRRLPCQHIMMVASKGHGFVSLPAPAVPARCSMKVTEELYDTLEKGLESVHQVINMVKSRPMNLRVPKSHPAPLKCESTSKASGGKRCVEYVRIRRHEKANMVVLSDAEKYARAQALFAPVIEKLSGLSTLKFYEEMNNWKSFTEKQLGGSAEDTSSTGADSAVIGADSEVDSIFDPLDIADVMAEMQADQELAMEGESLAMLERERKVADGDSSQSPSDEPELEATQISETPNDLPKDVWGDTQQQPSTNGNDFESGEERRRDDLLNEKQSDVTQPAKSHGVEVMKLPDPKPRTRKKTRQGWVAKQSKLAVVVVSSKVSISLAQIIQWAKYYPNVEKVSNVLDQYPVRMDDKFLQTRPVTCKVADETTDAINTDHAFVIPASLLRKASSAIILKREELHVAKEEAPWGLLVSFGSDKLVLHSSFLNRMENFYMLKAKCRGYIEDVKWLKQDWRLVQAHPVEPFSLEVKTSGLLHSEAAKVHQALAEDVLQKYSRFSLMTILKSKSGSAFVNFMDIAAIIPRNAMLNDAVISIGVQMITDTVKGSIALSSLMIWPSQPKQWLSETPFVILPLNLESIHWGVIIVEVAFPTTLRVHFYEPLHQPCYRREMKNAWKNTLLPYLEKWHTESGAKEQFPTEIFKMWIDEPAQPDGTSCGLLMLGMVYAFVRNAHRFERHRVTEAYVRVMRLRLTWLLVCTTTPALRNEQEFEKMQKTDEEVSKFSCYNDQDV